MKYSEKDMAALISEVENQFAEHLTKSEAKTEIANEVAEVKEEKIEKSEELNYDKQDFVEMDELYSSMTKSEAQAHFDSVSKIVSPIEVKTEEVKIEKSEETVETKVETESDLFKSEIENVKKENEDLKKNIETLTTALTTYIKGQGAPKQKAITKVKYIAKSEAETKNESGVDVSSLSKSEISSKLSEKAKDRDLKKSDREAINNFYLSNGSVDQIKHLL